MIAKHWSSGIRGRRTQERPKSSAISVRQTCTKREKRSPPSTSPCADLKAAYHNCFNRWYSEKFVKGHWDKLECVSEWQKYRDCLAQHLDDKHLSRFLETEGVTDLTDQADSKNPSGAFK